MKTALLVIDVQHGLFGGAPNPMGLPFEAEAVIALAASPHQPSSPKHPP